MEELSEENVMERIEEAIFTARDAKNNLHPETKKLQEALDAGVKPEDYYKNLRDSLAIENMQPRDLVKLSLTQNYGKTDARPNGWDDAKIEATLKKMDDSGIMEIRAEEIKTAYQQSREQLANTMKQQVIEKRLAGIKANDEIRTQQVNSTLEYFNSLTEINGIPLSQGDKAEIAEDFRIATTPDPKTGTSPLYDALQSNENMIKAFWFLKKGDDNMRKALTLAKEGAKKNFLEKLDKTPKITAKTAPHASEVINLDALTEPARN
jgi:hypothetical protein